MKKENIKSTLTITDSSTESQTKNNTSDKSSTNKQQEKTNNKSETISLTLNKSPKKKYQNKTNTNKKNYNTESRKTHTGKKFTNNKNYKNLSKNSNKRSANQFNNHKTELFGEPTEISGLLELSTKGFGFVRNEKLNYEADKTDVFITPDVVRKYSLRNGMWVTGHSKTSNRGPQLTEIHTLNGKNPNEIKQLYIFDELTATNPNKRIILELEKENNTTRVIDMLTPIGFGQRGLIVAPPRTGKTTILHQIAHSISTKHADIKLIILLIDERPEEVTEFRKKFPDADIMASSNDSEVKSHTKISQLAIERAKRYVEMGDNVFILLDSITRLSRAFNNSLRGKGRTGSGGVDVNALEIPRKLFAAARNTKEAGSLTIIATALIETNSKADEVIFREFKGTGNMEIVLDRSISEKMIFPAIDIFKSGTRREELLLPAHQLEKIYLIRRGLSGHKPVDAIEKLLNIMGKFDTNAQMLLGIKSS